MKLTLGHWFLAGVLAVYIVCDVLLTPPAGFETRNPARVTGIGIAALGLLFVGLALAVGALVFIFRRSGRAPMIAIVALVLFLPAFLTEQTGNFSSLKAPAAIEIIEIIQALVVLLGASVSVWVIRARA